VSTEQGATEVRAPSGSSAASAQPTDASGERLGFPSLTRQATALAAGSLATQGSALVLLIVLARTVAKQELGAYQQLNLIYGILSPLLVAGIPAALLYFVPRSADRETRSIWVGHAYLLLGSVGLATSILVVVFRSGIASAIGNSSLDSALVTYSPYPFFAFVAAVMPTALVASGRATRAALINALSGVLVLLAVLAAAAVKPDAAHMAAGLVIAQAVVAVVATVAVQRTVGISLRRGDFRGGGGTLLRYGIPLALTGVVGQLAFQFDRLVVSHQFSPALFAVYVVGAVELPLAAVVQQSVSSVLVPALARHHAAGDLAGLARLWSRAIQRTSLVLFPVFVFCMLAAGELVRLLFGGKYSESTDIFRIYLCLVPLRVATYGLITQAIGRTRINLSASFFLLATNAVLVIALVGPLGLKGPALGTVLATFGMALFYLVRLRKVLDLSLRALFPWRPLAANLALTAVAAVPVGLLAAAGLDGAVFLVLAACLFSATYLAVLVATNRLEARERELIRRAPRQALAVLGRLRPGHRERRPS
jgi:O-antigen/teichoic acid export membrane protein